MEKRVIALGFFDGVHLGHAALLACVRARAAELGAAPAVLTFDTHPDGVVSGDTVPLINALDGRIDLIERLHGISDVLVVPFDEAFRAMPWDAFVESLKRDYGAVHVVCGHNYYFGYRGAGNPERLVEVCRALGMGADVIDEVMLDGMAVCSTDIRKLIQTGDMVRAEQFLGHPHTLVDTVRHGYKLGRTLGAPTINMEIPAGVVVPPRGVYVTQVFLPGDTEGRLAVTNVGLRPTVDRGGERMTVESYILGFDGDLYGQTVRVEFYYYLRPEIRFDDVAALKEQIARDAADAKVWLRARTMESVLRNMSK
ncbi:MAG: riboflavin biosynthesis protein RibF [Oscillospiraceae bacterium]|nr:riboflavin biosynthesis protein RibF [Oscillospiraceae bacterium]